MRVSPGSAGGAPPLHEIYGNEVANANTPTRLEANVLNEVLKNAEQWTCAVTQDVCKCTAVQYNGDKSTRALPELQPLLQPNAVPQEGHIILELPVRM